MDSWYHPIGPRSPIVGTSGEIQHHAPRSNFARGTMARKHKTKVVTWSQPKLCEARPSGVQTNITWRGAKVRLDVVSIHVCPKSGIMTSRSIVVSEIVNGYNLHQFPILT